MKEEWKEIPDYPGYFVSNLGNIKSPRKGAFAGYIDSKRPYFYVALCKNNKIKQTMVHRLVASAFVSNPDNKPDVNHIDGNKHNNVYTNLEWCTNLENMQHRVNKINYMDSELRAQIVCTREETGLPHAELAKVFGVSKAFITSVLAKSQS